MQRFLTNGSRLSSFQRENRFPMNMRLFFERYLTYWYLYNAALNWIIYPVDSVIHNFDLMSSKVILLFSLIAVFRWKNEVWKALCRGLLLIFQEANLVKVSISVVKLVTLYTDARGFHEFSYFLDKRSYLWLLLTTRVLM